MTELEDERVNYIVLTDAGKPMFVRYGNDAEIARIGSLVQAIRTSILYGNLGLGDIQSLRSDNMLLVFMSVEALTLVAVAPMAFHGGTVNDATVKLQLSWQLEYIYAHVLFTMTQHVQSVLAQNASLDLRNLLLGTKSTNVLATMLDEATDEPAPFLLSSARTLAPLPAHVRQYVSKALQRRAGDVADTLYALLFVQHQLVSVVQPSFRPHQLKMCDLHLLLHFLQQQSEELRSTELWLPICLPRLDASGFVHCYVASLDSSNHALSIALVSTLGTSTQFAALRKCADQIRRDLGLPSSMTSVLRIHDNATGCDSTNGNATAAHSNGDTHSACNPDRSANDVAWSRTDAVVEISSSDEPLDCSDDYVDASGDGDGMIPYVGADDLGLLQHIATAVEPEQHRDFVQRYASVAGAWHFMFRIDVPVHRAPLPITTSRHAKRHPHKHANGHLPQCISSQLNFPFIDANARRRVFSIYQSLLLQLRLGSCHEQAVLDALHMIQHDHSSRRPGDHNVESVGQHCPTTCLLEAPPNIQGLTYVRDKLALYIAINGANFELLVTLPNGLSVAQGAALAARLARKLLADQDTLFVSQPLAWQW